MVKQSFHLLKEYVEKKDFKGWDPYDGLNSAFFQRSFFRKSSFIRLAWIQLFKRSPINLRKLFNVKEDHNAKGLGLFLSGYCNLYNLDPRPEYLEKIKYLSQRIMAIQNKSYSGSCWGYNFDWQARAFFQPKFTPTVVATTYVAYALLDAYDILKSSELLSTARSSCDFVLKDLNKTSDADGDFCFSYSPLDQTQVFNASLLGSRLLSRVYHYTHEKHLIDAARKSVSFCCKYQQADGAWAYGTLPFHQWIDNFHTGFNLECIHEYEKYSGDRSFHLHAEKGLQYYLTNFFTPQGESKYYNTTLYPIDIHAPAQLVVTFFRLGIINDHLELVNRVLSWTMTNMQDPSGYFYYQMKRTWNSKIPYMRWAQAWMFFSMTCYLFSIHDESK
ncbi:MAG: delta-aminolevulinic acid dehydratase [Bacteroidota bacterium]